VGDSFSARVKREAGKNPAQPPLLCFGEKLPQHAIGPKTREGAEAVPPKGCTPISQETCPVML